MSLVTVLGADGFIGSHIAQNLRARQQEVYTPSRQEDLHGRSLGHLIYCIGLTADFRQRPLETVEAHVCKLLEILGETDFDSLLYLSSTRLYGSGASGDEDDALWIRPQAASDLYNISKAMGESVAFASGNKVRVARISNVYGADFASANFLSCIVQAALTKKSITLETALDSAKDYIEVNDVADLLIKIATTGKQALYNVASGINTTNRELVNEMHRLTGCDVSVVPDAATIIFPRINIDRIKSEFDFRPKSVVEQLAELMRTYSKGGGLG